MSDSAETTFGLTIAFALPGFLLLWGISFSSPQIATWLAHSSPADAPTIGAFLYLAVASLALGILISAIRWATFEQFLYLLTGLKRSTKSESKLYEDGRRAAYQDKINNYYRYYQCYSHCMLAILISYVFNYLSNERNTSWMLAASVLFVVVVLCVKSRDELRSFNIIREEIL
jgi:hypothetical protein